jgi:hypothetical protein
VSEETAAKEEIVEGDALPVVADVRVIEPERPAGALALAPAAQAAAVAGASFVAGVATVAAIKHARNRPAISRRNRRRAAKRGAQLVEVVSTRSFLVDVHLLNRD